MMVRIEICRSLHSDIHSYWVIKLTRKTDHTLCYEEQYKNFNFLWFSLILIEMMLELRLQNAMLLNFDNTFISFIYPVVTFYNYWMHTLPIEEIVESMRNKMEKIFNILYVYAVRQLKYVPFQNVCIQLHCALNMKASTYIISYQMRKQRRYCHVIIRRML